MVVGTGMEYGFQCQPHPFVDTVPTLPSAMGALKKVIFLSSLVLLAALMWQWTRSVDIQGNKFFFVKEH